ncbi:MAG TPA: XRE family transcriptional regulator [Polyangiaceae bacterium]|nr:XRE family transcriptional regulator [Polyangiaceae bacterium]
MGANLRRLRHERGLSLAHLSKASGVSRAMLCQIETRRSAPTLKVFYRIARALGVPFSALLSDRPAPRVFVVRAPRAGEAPSAGGSSSRSLVPNDASGAAELRELCLAPRARQSAPARPGGTPELLIVAAGAVVVEVGGDEYDLGAGDAISFGADAPRAYCNRSDAPATAYLVVTRDPQAV